MIKFRHLPILLTIVAALTLFCLPLSSCGRQKAKERDFTVHCFSAGAADAFFIKTESSAILIDTAEKSFGKEILRYLNDNGTEKLDLLIITHFDKDHAGGCAEILHSIPVDKVLYGGVPKEGSRAYESCIASFEELGVNAQKLEAETLLSFDGADFTVVPPQSGEYGKSESNNSSLVVSVKYGENKFLFCGDIEKERISELLSQGLGTYDFVKIPHHGRWNKKSGELISETSPKFALITSSSDEPEDKETVRTLKKAGAKIFYTRLSDVEVSSDGKEITVQYK